MGRTITATASALVLLAVGVSWWQYRDGLSTSDALAGGDKSVGGGMNILLIGLDSRKDQDGNQLPPEILDKLHAGDGSEGGYNTNTLILMHIPPGGGHATAFSIPRDDLVNIPGQHPDKIKKAYGYAKAQAEAQLRGTITDQHDLETRSRDAGRRATLQAVRSLTGAPIDHFAEVNLAGFYDMSTALGGVEVCLNHPVQDPYSGANFPAGRQILNGSQALSFVRQRHGLTNGDLDRTHRQQAFLSSVAAKLRSAGTFANPSRLQGLIQAAKKDIVIDSDWNVFDFAQQAQNLSGGNLQFQTLPIKGYDDSHGEEVNLIDPGQIRNIVRTAFGYQPPPTTVDVLNGSETSGLAGSVANTVSAQPGFVSGQVSNTAHQPGSVITYHPGEQASATRLAHTLGTMPTRPDPTLPAKHLRVILGGGHTPHAADQPASTTPQAAFSAPAIPTPPTQHAPPPPNTTTPDIPCVD